MWAGLSSMGGWGSQFWDWGSRFCAWASRIGGWSSRCGDWAPRFWASRFRGVLGWRPLGLDFWTLWRSQNGPQRGQESKLKFEAFLKRFWKQGAKGRRHAGGPSGRGLLGSLPTVDAGLLRSCACHSAFGTPIRFAPRPQVSLKAQWPDLQWACGPKPATEPSVLCASVPQRSQRILWEVISNSVFDRVVGRAQASKRTLERLENEFPGAQSYAKMAPWRPPGRSLEAVSYTHLTLPTKRIV